MSYPDTSLASAETQFCPKKNLEATLHNTRELGEHFEVLLTPMVSELSLIVILKQL